jgi:small-conductance mechanosensitive channel
MRTGVGAVLVFCCMVLAASGADVHAQKPAQAASAASTPAASAPAVAMPAASAPAVRSRAASLVIYNRAIIEFRSVVAGFDPPERAELARHRIDTLLRRGGPGRVTLQPGPLGIAVDVDGATAFNVGPDDADTLDGETLEGTANRAAGVLRQVIDERRESHDLRAMLVASARAAVATLIYAGLLWAVAHAGHLLGVRLMRAAGEHARHLVLGHVQLFDRAHMRLLLRRVLFALFWIVALALTYGWLSHVLALFPFTRPWGERLTGYLVDALARIFGGIARGIPKLLVAVVILLIARFVASLLTRFFNGVEDGRLRLGWLDRETVRPTRRIAMIVVWLLALVMAYPYLPGANTEAFKGLSVLLGLMVSIGGASVVGQALSGLILMYTRTFRLGDYVRVGQFEGTVIEIGMYQTRIRTGLGEDLALPSSMILGEVTHNFSRPAVGAGFMLDTTVTIGYDAPWRQVHAMLEEAARRTPAVLQDPPPQVLQTVLSDFFVEYRLVTQASVSAPGARAEARGRLLQNIQDVFNEHGVQIMSPHYFSDPERPKIVPKARWFESPARSGRDGGAPAS